MSKKKQRQIEKLEDLNRDWDLRWHQEYDRRITEVGIEREKALALKHTADHEALGLARQNIAAEFEKANRLREQISAERGVYATKEDLAALGSRFNAIVKPLEDQVAVQQGSTKGVSTTLAIFLTLGGLGLALLTFIVAAAALYYNHVR
jgi:hypothetical protein